MFPQTLQNGRYRQIQKLGSGSMGEVYLVEDTRLNRKVAIKVILTEMSPDPNNADARERARLFQREATAIAQLSHPHILSLHDFGEEKVDNATLNYMVIQYCPEGSLDEWLRKRGGPASLSPEDVAHLIAQAADALQYAHNNHIRHLDVKLSNFLVQSRPDAPNRPDLLLADFGIAKPDSTTTGMSQAVRGTIAYMAPEQFNGVPVYATDQYALAVMAYLLLTGRPPFSGDYQQLMYQHFHVQPQPPSTLNPRLSKYTDEVILRALAKRPLDRYPSIAAFAQALQQSLTSNAFHQETQYATPQPVPFPYQNTYYTPQQPPPPPYPHTQYDNRNTPLPPFAPPPPVITSRPRSWRALLLVGLALLVILAGIGVFAVIRNNQVATANANATATAQSSNATVTANNATATVQANNATATAVTSTYPFSNTVALNDPLSDNSQNNQWDEGSVSGGSCKFSGQAYHVIALQSLVWPCFAANPHFSNFTYQVEMTITQGDAGGIVFRANSTNDKLYYFRVTQDGHYLISLYVDNTSTNERVLQRGTSSAITQGTNQTNLIAVVARGDNLTFYVNNQQITTMTDPTYSSGQIGVAAEYINGQTEVVFSNAKVWMLA